MFGFNYSILLSLLVFLFLSIFTGNTAVAATEFGTVITLTASGDYLNSDGIRVAAVPATLNIVVANPLFVGKTFFVGNIEHKGFRPLDPTNVTSVFQLRLATSWRDSKLFGVRVRYTIQYGGGAPLQTVTGIVTNDERIMLDDGTFVRYEDRK